MPSPVRARHAHQATSSALDSLQHLTEQVIRQNVNLKQSLHHVRDELNHVRHHVTHLKAQVSQYQHNDRIICQQIHALTTKLRQQSDAQLSSPDTHLKHSSSLTSKSASSLDLVQQPPHLQLNPDQTLNSTSHTNRSTTKTTPTPAIHTSPPSPSTHLRFQPISDAPAASLQSPPPSPTLVSSSTHSHPLDNDTKQPTDNPSRHHTLTNHPENARGVENPHVTDAQVSPAQKTSQTHTSQNLVRRHTYNAVKKNSGQPETPPKMLDNKSVQNPLKEASEVDAKETEASPRNRIVGAVRKLMPRGAKPGRSLSTPSSPQSISESNPEDPKQNSRFKHALMSSAKTATRLGKGLSLNTSAGGCKMKVRLEGSSSGSDSGSDSSGPTCGAEYRRPIGGANGVMSVETEPSQMLSAARKATGKLIKRKLADKKAQDETTSGGESERDSEKDSESDSESDSEGDSEKASEKASEPELSDAHSTKHSDSPVGPEYNAARSLPASEAQPRANDISRSKSDSPDTGLPSPGSESKRSQALLPGAIGALAGIGVAKGSGALMNSHREAHENMPNGSSPAEPSPSVHKVKSQPSTEAPSGTHRPTGQTIEGDRMGNPVSSGVGGSRRRWSDSSASPAPSETQENSLEVFALSGTHSMRTEPNGFNSFFTSRAGMSQMLQWRGYPGSDFVDVLNNSLTVKYPAIVSVEGGHVMMNSKMRVLETMGVSNAHKTCRYLSTLYPDGTFIPCVPVNGVALIRSPIHWNEKGYAEERVQLAFPKKAFDALVLGVRRAYRRKCPGAQIKLPGAFLSQDYVWKAVRIEPNCSVNMAQFSPGRQKGSVAEALQTVKGDIVGLALLYLSIDELNEDGSLAGVTFGLHSFVAHYLSGTRRDIKLT